MKRDNSDVVFFVLLVFIIAVWGIATQLNIQSAQDRIIQECRATPTPTPDNLVAK